MKTIKHLIPLFVLALFSFGAVAQDGAVQNSSATSAPQMNLQIHHGKRMIKHMRNGKRHEWRMKHKRHAPVNGHIRRPRMDRKK
jgi:uncharacterized membrane protein